MAALRGGGDFAHGPAHGDQGLWVLGGSDCHQSADQGGPALGDTIELLQQGAHIAGVSLGVAKLGRIVGGLHPWQTIKGVHTQARIIGHGWQTRERSSMARFGQGVFDKGVKRLIGLRHIEIRLGAQLPP